MKKEPLISICIPAFKRTEFLERLLQSIEIQTFKDYEVIVTDDSPDNTVMHFINRYKQISNIYYYKNKSTLGTPENWNEAIRKANGVWIKLMHDDDWFANPDALMMFYNEVIKDSKCPFLFSAYNNVDAVSNFKSAVYLSMIDNTILRLSPLNLFKKNYIGNPSCTLIKRNMNLFYDSDFKWVVDFEYFIRCLNKSQKYFYINRALINVGLNDAQVTKASFRKPEVEIPENHLLVEKMGSRILKNVFVYDYFWRLYRNLGIKNKDQIKKYYNGNLSPKLTRMIKFQEKISPHFLTIGIISKAFMLASYINSLFLKSTN